MKTIYIPKENKNEESPWINSGKKVSRETSPIPFSDYYSFPSLLVNINNNNQENQQKNKEELFLLYSNEDENVTGFVGSYPPIGKQLLTTFNPKAQDFIPQNSNSNNIKSTKSNGKIVVNNKPTFYSPPVQKLIEKRRRK